MNILTVNDEKCNREQTLNYNVAIRKRVRMSLRNHGIKTSRKRSSIPFKTRKLKLSREIELYKARDSERFMNEELTVVKAENEFLEAQLEDLKAQIAQARHQISMIEICFSSEKVKIEAHIKNLESHRKGFQDVFDREQIQHELRVKEQQEKEAAKDEIMRQKEIELAEKREQEAGEIAAIEAECDALEQECAVLKKRNNAIMLKLRRKLLETENTRRKLMKRSAIQQDVE